MKWIKWLVAGIAGAGALSVGGAFVYIHFVEGPAPALLAQSTGAAATTISGSFPASLDGTWNVSAGSIVGYRVNEELFGLANVAAGRTSSVQGSLQVSGTTVNSGSFTVDMTTVSSNKPRRDMQFQGRIMNTATYPTSTFTFSNPVDLPPLPSAGAAKAVTVTGKLTLHGTTRDVQVTLTCRRVGATASVVGSIPIVFSDWGIPNPSFGPTIRTQDHGVLEFALILKHA